MSEKTKRDGWCEWECSWCKETSTEPCEFFATNKPFCGMDCICEAGVAAMKEAEEALANSQGGFGGYSSHAYGKDPNTIQASGQGSFASGYVDTSQNVKPQSSNNLGGAISSMPGTSKI